MLRSLKPQAGFFLILSVLFASPPILRAQSPPEAAAPILSPPPDDYTDSVTVSLSSPTPEATVHCTTDDSIPTSASPACTSLNLTITTALKAITVAPGYADSPQASGLYVVNKSDAPPGGPDITFDFPTQDTTVYSRVPILVRVLPSNNIAKVYLSANGELLGHADHTGFGYYNYIWDTNPIAAGEYTLRANVLDDFGYTYPKAIVVNVEKNVDVDPQVAACRPAGVAPASGIFGLNDPPLGDDERGINELQALNVHWMRRDFNWATIEPTNGGGYNWWSTDQVVTWAHDAGIEVLVTLSGDPDWLGALDWPSRYDAYRLFAQAAAERYKPGGMLSQREGWQDDYGVSHWELWNEPNQDGRGWEWPPNPQVYASMLAFGQAGLRAADPNAVVVLGGLSGSGMYASGFLDYVYIVGAKDCFDVLNYHPYSFGDDFQLAVDGIREIVAPYGDGDKPIWFTEFGTISDGQRQDILLQTFAQKDVVPGFFWFSLRDNTLPKTNWGFFYNDWTKKQPAYDTLKGLLSPP